jgi:hypothetical protein
VRQPENEFSCFQAAFFVFPTPFYNIERHVKKWLQSATLGNKPIFQPNGGKIPPNFYQRDKQNDVYPYPKIV